MSRRSVLRPSAKPEDGRPANGPLHVLGGALSLTGIRLKIAIDSTTEGIRGQKGLSIPAILCCAKQPRIKRTVQKCG